MALANASFFRHIALADVDDDCDLDLLAIESPSDSLYVFLNETPQEDGCSGATPTGPVGPPVGVGEAHAVHSKPDNAQEAGAAGNVADLVGDMNGDGVVDATDFAIYLAEWGSGE